MQKIMQCGISSVKITVVWGVMSCSVVDLYSSSQINLPRYASGQFREDFWVPIVTRLYLFSFLFHFSAFFFIRFLHPFHTYLFPLICSYINFFT